MLRWFPWKQIVSRLARSRGFVDPVKLLSRLESFAQPLEVKEPLELLRAGMVFHARGLLNSSAIQFNLDWVWPYWVERQYDPRDDAFIPRAFSITHVNLTHRNWTAVGIPDCDELPIVDPAGLVTPFWDGWSLDTWVIADDGCLLAPSQKAERVQSLDLEGGVAVVTRASHLGLESCSRVWVRTTADGPELVLELAGTSGERAGWLVAAIRPYNPEGVSFVHRIELTDDRRIWKIDGKPRVRFEPAVESHRVSRYRSGDVHTRLLAGEDCDSVRCDVGMATAAAMYRLTPGQGRRVILRLPLEPVLAKRLTGKPAKRPSRPAWNDVLAACPRLESPDVRFRFLYDAAVRTLVLHSPGDVYPGPYTYKRFWFRDSAFVLDGLLCLGFFDRAERVLDTFPGRQTRNGHFLSQEGEWDSNGEALWILERFCRLAGRQPKRAWENAIRKGARWIGKKRMPGDGSLHARLLPAGFSAEHLGPNDFYYWDDFWGIGGLRSAAWLLAALGDQKEAEWSRREAADLASAVEASLARVRERLGRDAVPASPTRRLDAGAIGSLAAGYPLQLWAPDDPRLLDSTAFLLGNCFVDGGFFQDMIHSGINPYLTLHVAQVLLRAGDPRAAQLMTTVAELASPTGQWPEAVHPRTRGGCMGDGQHAWAAAEWVVMLRNAFVREEGGGLVLAAGIPDSWLEGGRWQLGPAPTPWGPVTVTVTAGEAGTTVSWEGQWRGEPPAIAVQRPGAAPVSAPLGASGQLTLPRRGERDLRESPAWTS